MRANTCGMLRSSFSAGITIETDGNSTKIPPLVGITVLSGTSGKTAGSEGMRECQITWTQIAESGLNEGGSDVVIPRERTRRTAPIDPPDLAELPTGSSNRLLATPEKGKCFRAFAMRI